MAPLENPIKSVGLLLALCNHFLHFGQGLAEFDSHLLDDVIGLVFGLTGGSAGKPKGDVGTNHLRVGRTSPVRDYLL